ASGSTHCSVDPQTWRRGRRNKNQKNNERRTTEYLMQESDTHTHQDSSEGAERAAAQSRPALQATPPLSICDFQSGVSCPLASPSSLVPCQARQCVQAAACGWSACERQQPPRGDHAAPACPAASRSPRRKEACCGVSCLRVSHCRGGFAEARETHSSDRAA